MGSGGAWEPQATLDQVAVEEGGLDAHDNSSSGSDHSQMEVEQQEWEDVGDAVGAEEEEEEAAPSVDLTVQQIIDALEAVTMTIDLAAGGALKLKGVRVSGAEATRIKAVLDEAVGVNLNDLSQVLEILHGVAGTLRFSVTLIPSLSVGDNTNGNRNVCLLIAFEQCRRSSSGTEEREVIAWGRDLTKREQLNGILARTVDEQLGKMGERHPNRGRLDRVRTWLKVPGNVTKVLLEAMRADTDLILQPGYNQGFSLSAFARVDTGECILIGSTTQELQENLSVTLAELRVLLSHPAVFLNNYAHGEDRDNHVSFLFGNQKLSEQDIQARVEELAFGSLLPLVTRGGRTARRSPALKGTGGGGKPVYGGGLCIGARLS